MSRQFRLRPLGGAEVGRSAKLGCLWMGPGQGYVREKGKGGKTKGREGCGGGELTTGKLSLGRECWETRLRAGPDFQIGKGESGSKEGSEKVHNPP